MKVKVFHRRHGSRTTFRFHLGISTTKSSRCGITGGILHLLKNRETCQQFYTGRGYAEFSRYNVHRFRNMNSFGKFVYTTSSSSIILITTSLKVKNLATDIQLVRCSYQSTIRPHVFVWFTDFFKWVETVDRNTNFKKSFY